MFNKIFCLLIFLGASLGLMVPAFVQAKENVSANWSGYISNSGKYAGVGASWKVAAVKPSSGLKTDSAWVGIGGVLQNDLIQAGTEATVEAGKAPTYQAWYEMLPDFARPIDLSISPNDKLTVSIEAISADRWKIAFANQTTGKLFSKIVSYKSSRSSAEWIEEMPSDGQGLLPLDNFGKIRFENSWTVMNGKKVSLGNSKAFPVKIANSAGKTLASPSKLLSKGTAFTVARSKLKAGIYSAKTFGKRFERSTGSFLLKLGKSLF